MSFLQDLKGVKVLPSPALRGGDQANDGEPFFDKNPSQWPQGYAFGGWIYDAQVQLGFSKRPTQVTLSVVLENDSTINRIQRFDISDRLLEVSLITESGEGGAAANFGHEFWAGHFYTIDLHGIKFNRMYLFDYNISVESGQKTLSVTLKDYSLILDKIYVGLMNRQGPGRIPSTPTVIQPVCGPGAVYSKNEHLLRKGAIAAKLTTFCPNCYLMGEDFNTGLARQNRGLVDPEIKTSYGGYLKGFFTKQTGWIQRNVTIGSFIGRPHVNSRAIGVFQNNFVTEGNTTRYEVAKKCYGETKSAWDDTGGQPIIVDGDEKPWYFYQNTSVVVDGQSYDCGASTNMVSLLQQHAGIPHQDFEVGQTFDSMKTIRYPIADYWGELYARVANTAARYGQGQSQNNIGFTMDGGFIMIGSEEFSEAQCGSAPNVSYNFSELITSLKNRGFIFHGVPDKNPRFRANYIGTLREVLEQWCGIFSLDYYYQDTDNGSDSTTKQRGFHFLDLEQGARIDPIRGVVDPSHHLGREFGAEKPDQEDQIATSVILSYKESATLENTYIQSCITSNVRPFSVKERKKTIKRYVPILPLHPCDFSIPNHEYQEQTTLLGEKYKYYKIANFIPWWPKPQDLPLENGWDHRRRMWNRTNRELWEMDVAMALCRLDPDLRDMSIANRICDTALSERCPHEPYPEGHEHEGDPVRYLEMGHGGRGREATQQEIDAGVDTIGSRLGWNPGSANHCHPPIVEADFDANMAALGFEEVVEVEDFLVKENIIKTFLRKEDIPDVSYDVSHFKMFLGYYDEKVHQQHKDWEKRCAESMYGFGAVFGGTIPAEPFIPRDYYGVRDGNAGFEEGTCGESIPKLKSSFEPNADQFPHYSLEALDAPFKGLLVNSGMYLPTGLHIAKLDNPWGTSVEEYEKEFWRKFSDNACKEYNNSLNIIEDAGFNNIPNRFADDGTAIGWKKNSDPFPFKKQGWEMGMFTPKFFKDAEKIFDEMPGVIQGLHTEGRLVDEVSVSKRSVEYGEQRFCKKLTLMVLTDTRPNKHPNISFACQYLTEGAENSMIRRQRELWEIAEQKRKARDDIRNRCDVDLVYEFCQDAVQRDNEGTYSNRDGWGQVDKQACAVDPTGVYKEGFARELIGGYKNPNGVYPEINPGMPNSRVLRLQIIRNPTLKGFIPTSEDGEFHLEDLKEEMEVLPRTPLNFDIVYPVNNFAMQGEDGSSFGPVTASVNEIPHQFYSGIWTAEQTLEDRMPETVEIYGNPPATHNPTAGVRIVNNTVDPDLGAIMDPDAKGFITQMYDNYGQQIETIEGFHNHVAHGHQWGPDYRGSEKGLNDFSVIKPNKKIDLRLAGSLMDFPYFREYCYPAYGLQDLSISFSDQGVQTSLSFADRPAQAPQMEGILNKIGPKTM
jgi:hypothetical protein